MKGLGMYRCYVCGDSFMGITALRKHNCYNKDRYEHTQIIIRPKNQSEMRKYFSACNKQYDTNGNKKI